MASRCCILLQLVESLNAGNFERSMMEKQKAMKNLVELTLEELAGEISALLMIKKIKTGDLDTPGPYVRVSSLGMIEISGNVLMSAEMARLMIEQFLSAQISH